MYNRKSERAIERIGKYMAAVLSAKRAKDLAQKMPGEFVDSGKKELSYAIAEIADGKIVPCFNPR